MNLLHRFLLRIIKRSFPYRSSLARLTRWPWLGSWLDSSLFEGDRIFYVPNQKTIKLEQTIELPKSMALPHQVAEYFIQRAGSYRLMHACICRESMGCKDFPVDLGCLFVGPAARQIPDQLGRLVTQTEALAHLERCREAGLVHLVGLNKLDSVWLQVSPHNQLLTICNCCPCCCLWRVLPQVSESIAQRVTRLPGVQVEVLPDCRGCGQCQKDVCFVNAIQWEGRERRERGQARISDACRGCGRCVQACPHQAIVLRAEHLDYVEKTIERLQGLVSID